jgi:uncharacterized protein
VKRFLVVLLMTVTVSALGAEGGGGISRKKQESIRTLLELTGMSKVVDQVISQMFEQFAKNAPSVPPEAWQRLQKKMKSEELIDLILPVYDKYYTQEDLDGMIAFYRSPVGQKVVRTLPDVSREGFVIGQEWGKRKGEEVIKELRAEGLLKE